MLCEAVHQVAIGASLSLSIRQGTSAQAGCGLNITGSYKCQTRKYTYPSCIIIEESERMHF